MSNAPTVIRYPDAAAVAEATAARLLAQVASAVVRTGVAHVVLTGGGVGTASLAAISRSSARATIDWRAVHLWWGDERFLPPGDADRNETQARAALLDALPVPAAQVHPMPALGAGPWSDDPDAAARQYATELAARAPEADGVGRDQVPRFDVVLLGVGPDGHVASLFPGHAALATPPGISVVGVHGSPKPPPIRVSLTFEALNRAEQVWLLAAGAEKADAVGRAFAGAPVEEIPAVGVRGTQDTIWLLDEAAASGIAPD